ncbi:MAG: ABC transporter permease [Kineosporiaceae bacterium]|nr:ABC transporter permease [Aeromicrobium sp.]
MRTDDPDVVARRERLEREPLAVVGGKSGFFTGAWGSLVEVWVHRELLGRLVRREVKARYKDSTLGIVWSLIRPLAQLSVYYFAIGKILGAARATPDFAIFVFIGLTMWALFAEIISGGTTSILANSGLIKKVYLPREIFPLSAVGSALVNFAFQLVVLVLGEIFLASRAPIWSLDLLLAPLAFVTLVVFATAIGILLSALNVYFRDIQHFVEIALIFLFWASPIVYSFTFVQRALNGSFLEQIYLANPVTIAIVATQKALWGSGSTATGALAQQWPADIAIRLLIALAVSAVLLWIAQRIFARLQGNFAQEL